MTEPEHQPTTLVENMILLRREDFDELLDRAAERGAERCLAHLGLENGSAAKDIRELRDLLRSVARCPPNSVADHHQGRDHRHPGRSLLVGAAMS